MWKWIFVALVIVVALGLWMILDPNARTTAARMGDQLEAGLGRAGIEVDGNSLFAPISRAFGSFADSVSELLSPKTIRIEMPTIKLPN